jgi:hypothetical protein
LAPTSSFIFGQRDDGRCSQDSVLLMI